MEIRDIDRSFRSKISKVAAKSQLSRPRCARLGESFDTEGRATASAAPGVEG